MNIPEPKSGAGEMEGEDMTLSDEAWAAAVRLANGLDVEVLPPPKEGEA